VPEAFAYRLPKDVAAEALAPLLCAGIIGYRALTRAQLPPGGRLGIYGFGGSAHLTAQLAIAQGAQVHVFTRGQHARDLARRLGASSVQDAHAASPAPLDAAILFAPIGDLVPVALAALGPGGTLAVAGIHLSDVPTLDYHRHLFQERTLTSVTSNTRRDGAEFLALAMRLGVRATTRPYPLGRADEALRDLAAGRVCGAAVLIVN
jgi:propanol-preferring alcohol dehydrogenase